MQHVAVGIGLRARREAELAQQFGHDAGHHRAAQIAAHRLRAGDPVVAARALHGVEALVDQHHHRGAVIGLDLLAVFLVREPGVARDLADAGQVGAECVGQRLDGVGVGLRFAIARAVGRRLWLPTLERHQRADHLQQAPRQRRLEGEARALGFRLVAEIAMQSALEECRALGHLRHLVVEDERGRPFGALHRLHGKAREVALAFALPVALAAGLRAVQAQPIGEAARIQGVLVQRRIGFEVVVGGDEGDGEIVEIWIAQAVVGANGKPRQHRQPFGVNETVAGKMCAGGEAHGADMAGDADRDLGRAHGGNLGARRLRSIRAPDCPAPAGAGARPG